MSSDTKVVVVTGASKGIGFAIVKGVLTEKPDWTVYLTARNEDKANEAANKIEQECHVRPRVHQLDIESDESVRSFKSFLIDKHEHGIDVVINNAGILPNIMASYMNEPFKVDKEAWQKTIKNIYFGSLAVCKELMPLIADNGKVIFVSSRFSQLAFMHTKKEKQQLLKDCAKVEDVTELMDQLCKVDVDKVFDPSEKDGWLADEPEYEIRPHYPYGMAKLGLNLLTLIYQRQLNEEKQQKNIQIYACCPGLVKTDMNRAGPKSPEEGADTIVWLALQPKDSTIRGLFLAERKVWDPFTIEEGVPPFGD